MIRYRSCFLSLLGVLILALPASAKKEGFGLQRKVLQLQRKNPPQVVITGERIRILAKTTDGGQTSIAARLESQLGSELIQHDSRLTLDPDRPETEIEITLLQADYDESWESRTSTRREKTGRTDSKGKAIYRDRQVTTRYKVLSHHVAVSFIVNDLRRRETIYADSVEVPFKKDYAEGRNAPSKADLESTACRRIVETIVRRLTSTTEMVQVLLPKGSLEELGKLAEAGLWSRYSEGLEGLSPKASSADESYRQYGIGLAYEALGYGAGDPDTTLRYLEKAAQHYNQALAANPGEKYFSKPFEGFFLRKLGGSLRSRARKGEASRSGRRVPPPLERVQDSLTKYRTLVSQDTVIAAFENPGSGAKSLDGEAKAEAGGLSNAQVLEMVEAGLPEDIVLSAIEDADQCSFDVSPAGLVELSRAQVPPDVIRKMQGAPCVR